MKIREYDVKFEYVYEKDIVNKNRIEKERKVKERKT